jgi:hypothetical protein
MRAFALPAFLDGRVRINLKGRERHGMVEDLKAECAAVETLLGACRDALTGEPAVRAIDCPGIGNCEAGPFAADMIVSWNGAPLGLVHPELGTIGPVPFRRTGGHTGKDGVAWFAGAGFEPGEHPRGDAVDLVPTVVELLGEQVPDWMFGKSIAGEIGAKVAEAAK